MNIEHCLLHHLIHQGFLHNASFICWYGSSMCGKRRSRSFNLQFIGGLFQTDQPSSVPRDRWHRIQYHLPPALQQPHVLCQRQVLLGLLTSALDLTSRGRLQMHPRQMFLVPSIRRQDQSASIVLQDHLKPMVDSGVKCLRRHLLDRARNLIMPLRQRLSPRLGSTSRGQSRLGAMVRCSASVAHQ